MRNTPIKKIKRIHIIINPASGKIEPILPIINLVMSEACVDWDVSITKKSGDACHFAKEAVKKGVDAIGVYGGDGTIMEAISGMIGAGIPLAILPGGTANVLATELKISKDLKEACQLICQDSSRTRIIDVGEFNKRYFILRLGLGFEAEMIKGAERETKNKFGRLAYVLSSAAALRKIKEARYHLKIDGKTYEAQGITCIIANSGNIGFQDLSLDNHIDISDGLLDVIIVRRICVSLFAYILSIFFHRQNPDNVELVQHWQGKDIRISSTPQQSVQCDGEFLDQISINAKIIPGACSVIVPIDLPLN